MRITYNTEVALEYRGRCFPSSPAPHLIILTGLYSLLIGWGHLHSFPLLGFYWTYGHSDSAELSILFPNVYPLLSAPLHHSIFCFAYTIIEREKIACILQYQFFGAGGTFTGVCFDWIVSFHFSLHPCYRLGQLSALFSFHFPVFLAT